MHQLAGPDELTDRQREVLRLISSGLTNAQIADRLGISLDGVKWHVREILSKLGVDSRAQAAELWRGEQRPGPRLRRAIAGVPVLLRALGIAVVALLAAVAVLAIILVLRGGQGDAPAPAQPDQAPGSQTGNVAATLSPSASATALPSPTAAGPGVLATASGLPVYELVLLPGTVALPRSTLVYFTQTCGACIDTELFRLIVDETGAPRRETLLTKDQPGMPPGRPLVPVVADGDGRFAAAWCLKESGHCGKRHDGSVDDAIRLVVWSFDGGVTWSEIGRQIGPVQVLGFHQGEVLTATVRDPVEYQLYPSGLKVPSPEPRPVATLPSGAGVYRVYEADLFGRRLALANEDSPVFYLAPPGGEADEYLAFPGGTLHISMAWSDTHLLGSAERSSKVTLNEALRSLPGLPRLAVVVDVAARTVAPVDGLGGDSENDFVVPLHVESGEFLHVAGTDSCLNVRAEPDAGAEIIGCFADGVLLQNLGGETAAGDGREWRGVRTTPGGEYGWAAAEYLR